MKDYLLISIHRVELICSMPVKLPKEVLLRSSYMAYSYLIVSRLVSAQVTALRYFSKKRNISNQFE